MKKTEYIQPEVEVLELSFEGNFLDSGNGSGQDLGSPVIVGGGYGDYFN